MQPAAKKENATNELVFTRVIDAPRELVFEAWTNPQHISNWWGPDGFTTTTNVIDVKVGGIWDYVMHGPDGTDYPNKSIFRVVEKPKRLEFSNVGGYVDDQHLTCEMRVAFTESNGKTEVTLRMLFPSSKALEHAKDHGAARGGSEAFTRLHDLLTNRG